MIRKYPIVPGVDLAGTVEESSSPNFKPGDKVVVTGCGTSETLWGGYSQYARLDAEFVVPLPAGFNLQQAMGIGTAGFTAMQSVMALEEHGVKPGGREVVVTGAAGGVGSVAIAILGKLGYKVVASSGRAELHDYLRGLGASEIIDRNVLAAPSKRPLDSERWAAGIDSWSPVATHWPDCFADRSGSRGGVAALRFGVRRRCSELPLCSRSFCVASICWVSIRCACPTSAVFFPGDPRARHRPRSSNEFAGQHDPGKAARRSVPAWRADSGREDTWAGRYRREQVSGAGLRPADI